MPESYRGERETRTQVAEAVGMKPRTYAKLKHVYDATKDETKPEPVRAEARQQMAALDAGDTNPTKAERAVRGANLRATPRARRRAY